MTKSSSFASRQKLGMLIDALREEENGLHQDDEMMRSLNEIAKKSASERPFKSNFPFLAASRRNSVTMTPGPAKKSIGKNEKDKLNTKQRTSRLLQRADKEALSARANSLKRAIHNIMDYSEKSLLSKQHKLQVDNLVMNPSSSDTSPCISSLVPPITIISPSSSQANLLPDLSPLPDMRRDSMAEFFNTLNLPAPAPFDDSRRSSAVHDCIMEIEENGAHLDKSLPLESSREEEENTDTNRMSTISDSQCTTAPNDISLEYDRQVPELLLEKETLLAYERLGFKPFSRHPSTEKDEMDEQLREYRPIEVQERNLIRQQQIQSELSSSTLTTTTITTSKLNEACSHLLQIPNIVSIYYYYIVSSY
jgi:diacylglycerol kinase (ATP)